MNSVLNINPTKRVTEKDFYVKCILPYEDNHLQTHKINNLFVFTFCCFFTMTIKNIFDQ